jgi:putative membrane protein
VEEDRVHTIELRSRRRRLTGLAIAVAALVLVQPQAAWAEPGVPNPPNQLITDTGEGALSAADRDFAVKVRLAGLWEIPAGQMAQQKSGNAQIQQIGKDIAAQHVILDKMVRAVGKKLDIELPDKPNADQQGWLGEMRGAEGADFDQIYIDRLRAAHGKIFPAIATIRTSTRNDSIRKLAQRANQFVMTHLTLLESSGIVDFAALPTAPPPAAATSAAAPAAATVRAASETEQNPITTPTVIGVVVASFVIAALATWRLLPGDRRRRRYRSSYYR